MSLCCLGSINEEVSTYACSTSKPAEMSSKVIKFLTGSERSDYPELFRAMHIARRIQFIDRLGWDLQVDVDGEEFDQFDTSSAMYVIVTDEEGAHLGSARLLPSVLPNLTNEVFLKRLGVNPIVDSKTWECSRFCVSKRDRKVASQLILGIAHLASLGCFTNCLAVYDKRMERVYRAYQINPRKLSLQHLETDEVKFGLWRFDRAIYKDMLARLRIDPTQIAKVPNRADGSAVYLAA